MTPSILSDAARSRRRRAIGQKLAELRGEMNQTELGLVLDAPQTTVSRWERGTIDMNFEQALEVEVALGLKHGTLARTGGYIEAIETDQAPNIVEMLSVDPTLDEDLRQDLIAIYRAYQKLSSRLRREEGLSVVQPAVRSVARSARKRQTA
jgi:DNA-binding XRE family transcriptional regulator